VRTKSDRCFRFW